MKDKAFSGHESLRAIKKGEWRAISPDHLLELLFMAAALYPDSSTITNALNRLEKNGLLPTKQHFFLIIDPKTGDISLDGI
jgi:hypothetical protein